MHSFGVFVLKIRERRIYHANNFQKFLAEKYELFEKLFCISVTTNKKSHEWWKFSRIIFFTSMVQLLNNLHSKLLQKIVKKEMEISLEQIPWNFLLTLPKQVITMRFGRKKQKIRRCVSEREALSRWHYHMVIFRRVKCVMLRMCIFNFLRSHPKGKLFKIIFKFTACTTFWFSKFDKYLSLIWQWFEIVFMDCTCISSYLQVCYNLFLCIIQDYCFSSILNGSVQSYHCFLCNQLIWHQHVFLCHMCFRLTSFPNDS